MFTLKNKKYVVSTNNLEQTYFLLVGRRFNLHDRTMLNGVCGRRLMDVIQKDIINISDVEDKQVKHEEILKTVPSNDLLSGFGLDERSKLKLTKPPTQLTLATIYKFLWEYLPKPASKLLKNPSWIESVFSLLSTGDVDWLLGVYMFKTSVLRLNIHDYLSKLAEMDSSVMIFCSDATRVYMSVDESLEFLNEWILFQFGSEKRQFIKNMYFLLARLRRLQKR